MTNKLPKISEREKDVMTINLTKSKWIGEWELVV